MAPKSDKTRREFLRVAATASGGLLLGCGTSDMDAPTGGPDAGQPAPDAQPLEPIVPPEQFPESDAFGLGVSSGDAATDGVVAWTRYDGQQPLGLRVWEMDGETYVDEHVLSTVAVSEAGFVHAAVEGLIPGARYRYAFIENGDTRSPIGGFRTAIAQDSLEPLTIGATACNNGSHEFDTLERAGERTDLDLFLFLGDTAYCDQANNRDEYRDIWAQHLGKIGSRKVRASTSVLATWDDHEVDNDWNPELISDDRVAAATGAFFENLPLRRVEDAPDRIWRRMRWGMTAEIFCLDSRSERKPSTILFGDDQYLSPEQLAWLKDGLANSPAVFKLIMNSVPISNFPSAFDLYPTDRWEAYPQQRENLLQFIDDEQIPGVLWISGDFHLGSAQRIALSGPGAGQIEVLAGPGAQNGNPLVPVLTAPQFDFATGENNYTVFHLDPSTGIVRVVFHNAADEVIFENTYAVG